MEEQTTILSLLLRGEMSNEDALESLGLTETWQLDELLSAHSELTDSIDLDAINSKAVLSLIGGKL